jgi:membrane fusion protein (multidrug efflux system)
LVVRPSTLKEKLVSTGVLKANQDVVISSEVAGQVQKVSKALGDRCEKGELLLRIDPESYQIALAQADAQLKQSRIALDHSERDFKRTQALKESAVATAQQLDQAEGAQSSAAANVEQAQAAFRVAERNLRETKVRCPFSGYVAEMMVDTGQAVGPQTPLARLVDTSELKLLLSVTSAEIGRIKTGQAVFLRDPALPDQSYQGTVSRLGVAADTMTRNFPVEVLVGGDAGGLRAGQVVHATLELGEHSDALAIPSEAVVTSDDEKIVFVVADGKAQKIPVSTGPEIEGNVIVTDGLKPGSEVIIVGGEDLTQGSLVEVVRREDQAASDKAE